MLAKMIAICLFVSEHDSRARWISHSARAANNSFICTNNNGARDKIKLAGHYFDEPQCSKHASLPLSVLARCLEGVMVGRGVDA